MKATAEYNPARTLAEIRIPSSRIQKVRDALWLNGILEMGPSGHGWQYIDGGIMVCGSPSAVETAVRIVLRVANGPDFESADVIAARHRQGAMP